MPTSTNNNNNNDKAKSNNKKNEWPLKIVPYRGYGTANTIYCRGRLIRDKGISSTAADSTWQNLKNTYRRFESDEIPNAALKMTYQNNEFELFTDYEGYYFLQKDLYYTVVTSRWHTANLQLIKTESDGEEMPILTAKADILVPSNNAEVGIISDIDDTLIETNVTSKIKMIYKSIAYNAYKRHTFKGAPALYWALKKGSDGQQNLSLIHI